MLEGSVAFQPGSLWRGPLLPRGRLARVVWSNDTHVYALEVSGKYDNNYPKNPTRMQRSRAEDLVASGLCERSPEAIRTVEMARSDDAISPDEKAERDARYALIEPLVVKGEPLESLLDPVKRAVCIRRRMSETGAARVRLARILFRYFWFGSDRNALLSRKSEQGGRDHPRKNTATKLGRPTATTQLQRRDIDLGDDVGYVKRRNLSESAGVNASEWDFKRYRLAIDKYWVLENKSLNAAYDEMCANLYVAFTRDESGRTQRHRIDPVHIPSIHHFKKFATKYIRENHLAAAKVGAKDFSDNMAARTGSAADITFGPTSVADSDPTVIKRNVGSDDAYCTPLGTATVHLTVDRASHCILAFHDFIGAESTNEYKTSVFWAIVGTEAYLKAIDCKAPEVGSVSKWGNQGGFFDALFVDRGPGRSEGAHDAIVGRLQISREVPPPREPVLKAVVESLNGYLQRKAAGSGSGAWNRRKGTRHQQRREESALEPPIPRRQFQELLVAAVAEHNEFSDASHLLTADMKRDGVRPNPISIQRWGEKNVRARRTAQFSPEDIYLNLLEAREVAAQRNGVHWDKMYFTSREYERFVEAHAGRDTPIIEVYYDRTDPNRRYWKQSDGTIAILEATLATARRFEGMSADEVELDRLRQLAEVETQNKRRLRAARVTNAQQKIVAANDGRPKLRKKPKVAVARRVEHAKDALQQRQMAHELLGVETAPEARQEPAAEANNAARGEKRLSKLEQAALNAANRLLSPDSE